MIYICCTARLEAALSFPQLVRPEPTRCRLGVWYANDMDDRNAILLEAQTRLVVIIPLAPTSTFADRAVADIRSRVGRISSARGAVDRELQFMTAATFTNTPHAGLQSSLEAIRRTAVQIRSDHPRFSLTEVADRLCTIPVRAKGFQTPWELAIVHLGGTVDGPASDPHAT